MSVRKVFKVSVFVMLIVPLLVFLGFVGAMSVIDFNRYKPQIEQEIKTFSGRDFKIEGAIEVSVMPFSLTIGQSSLKNAQRFLSQPSQFSFKALQIELSLKSLFWDKKIDVTSLEVIEPKLVLMEDAQGNNWDDLPELTQVLTWLKEAVPTVELSEQASKKAWQLNSLVVQGGEIQFIGNTAQENWHLSKVSLVSNQLKLDQMFSAHLSLEWLKSASQRQLELNLNAEMVVPSALNTLEVSAWQGLLKSQLLGQQAYPQVAITHQGRGLQYQWNRQILQLETMELQALNGAVRLAMSGEVNALLKGEAITQNVDYQKWASQLNLSLPQLIVDEKLTNQNAQIQWHYNSGDERVVVDSMVLQTKVKE